MFTLKQIDAEFPKIEFWPKICKHVAISLLENQFNSTTKITNGDDFLS